MKTDDLFASVAASLRDNGVSNEVISKVMNDLQKTAEEAKAEKGDAPPKAKSKYTILVSDPNGVLAGTDLVGWVLKADEGTSPSQVVPRIKQTITAFNGCTKGPKRRSSRANSLAEGIEAMSARWWRSTATDGHTLSPLTKQAVSVITTDNKL